MSILSEDFLGFPIAGWLATLAAVSVLMLPVWQWIDYLIDCHRYGKIVADEIRRRW